MPTVEPRTSADRPHRVVGEGRDQQHEDSGLGGGGEKGASRDQDACAIERPGGGLVAGGAEYKQREGRATEGKALADQPGGAQPHQPERDHGPAR